MLLLCYKRKFNTMPIGISKQYCKHIEEHNDHVPRLENFVVSHEY